MMHRDHRSMSDMGARREKAAPVAAQGLISGYALAE
jgi:hypothetical protein